METKVERAGPFRAFRSIPALIVWFGACLCCGALAAYRLDQAVDVARFVDASLFVVASTALALALRAFFGSSIAAALCAIGLLGLLFFVGPMSALGTVGFALCAFTLGDALLPQTTPHRRVLSLPVGMTLIAALIGWLTPLPIHHAGLYWLAIGVVMVWRGPRLRAAFLDIATHCRAAVASAPVAAAIAMLCLDLALTGAWLPTMQADDLAYHLALPVWLQNLGYYRPDPAQQIWALAPWLGDVVQGIVQVLSGHEARGDVNGLWLFCAAASLWTLTGALGSTASTRWLAVAAFASLPTLGMLCAGMQTELPAAALLLALVLAIQTAATRPPWVACAVLAGGLIALKFGQAVAAAVILIWLFMRQAMRVSRAGLAGVALALIVAGSSYFYAWLASGNPMLPLFNDLFRAPLMPAQQLYDPRWHAGFSLALPWSMTFATERYLEARSGGFGFVLVAFGGAWLLALYRPRTRAIALVATLVMALPLLAIQYARYAFPGMVLLLAPMFAAGEWAVGARRFGALAVAVCLLDLAFQANAGWSMMTVQRRRLLTHAGDPTAVLRLFAPERVLIGKLKTLDRGDSIVLALDPTAPNVAELGPRGRNLAWYAPALEQARLAAEADASGGRWQALIEHSQARWLLLRPEHLSAAQRAALTSLRAERVDAVGEAELWSVGPVSATSPAAP